MLNDLAAEYDTACKLIDKVRSSGTDGFYSLDVNSTDEYGLPLVITNL